MTQNIDGLHLAAGTSPERLIEIHGSIRESICLACGDRRPMPETLERVRAGDPDPACERCGGILKSATISFGQNLDPALLARAEAAASACDMFLAIGTSLTVYPVARLPELALDAGARLVIVNAEPTPLDNRADAVLRGRAGDVLGEIVAGRVGSARGRPHPARRSRHPRGPLDRCRTRHRLHRGPGPRRGAVAGVDVRGSAPGTRETDLLRPTALVERINAICLAGGSAFGLAAADGVMRRLAERGIGFATAVRPVPIVPAAILFDLGVGDPDAFPDADAGYAATLAAEANEGTLEGRVGAGTGATRGEARRSRPALSPVGVGSAARRLPDGSVVGALVVNNALGDIHARDGRLAGHGCRRLAATAHREHDAGRRRHRCAARPRRVPQAGRARPRRAGHRRSARRTPCSMGTSSSRSAPATGAHRPPEAFFALGVAAVDAIGEAIERSVSTALRRRE